MSKAAFDTFLLSPRVFGGSRSLFPAISPALTLAPTTARPLSLSLPLFRPQAPTRRGFSGLSITGGHRATARVKLERSS
uniref:Uncharacterized protein n=1 Tax=Oryza meridionalis TaxID=40149 RepID=A0A0E0DQG1_9ORYZ